MRQCGQLKDQLLQQVEDWKSGHGMVMEHSSSAFKQRALERGEVRRCTSACARVGGPWWGLKGGRRLARADDRPRDAR